jgi:hypothetical protein
MKVQTRTGNRVFDQNRQMGPRALDAYTELKSVWLHYG